MDNIEYLAHRFQNLVVRQLEELATHVDSRIWQNQMSLSKAEQRRIKKLRHAGILTDSSVIFANYPTAGPVTIPIRTNPLTQITESLPAAASATDPATESIAIAHRPKPNVPKQHKITKRQRKNHYYEWRYVALDEEKAEALLMRRAIGSDGSDELYRNSKPYYDPGTGLTHIYVCGKFEEDTRKLVGLVHDAVTRE